MTSPSAPFFSVVTIVWNDLPGFRLTRASIESQTCDDFEWIVADGGSTDGTCEELRNTSHPALSWVSERDAGLYDAMNKGLARAKGRYVIFMNGGDSFAGPDVLQQVKQAILANSSAGDPDFVYGDAWEQTPTGERFFKRGRSIGWIDYGMLTHHQAMFYSRQAVGDMRFDLSIRLSSDYDFTCRVYMLRRSSLRLDITICVFSRGGLSEKIADVGRRNNWQIQRDVLRLSLPRRILIRSAYLFSAFMRTRLKPIYDRVRFQRSANAG